MSDIEDMRLNDDMLEEIAGGTEDQYGMSNDPLYKQFLSIWEKDHKTSGNGMTSRADFLNMFQKWLKAGMPEGM